MPDSFSGPNSNSVEGPDRTLSTDVQFHGTIAVHQCCRGKIHRTGLTDIAPEVAVDVHKSLATVERTRTDLRIRPVCVNARDHVRGHVFPCMQAWYVEWHMCQGLAPLLFEDADQQAVRRQRTTPVRKVQTGETPDCLHLVHPHRRSRQRRPRAWRRQGTRDHRHAAEQAAEPRLRTPGGQPGSDCSHEHGRSGPWNSARQSRQVTTEVPVRTTPSD